MKLFTALRTLTLRRREMQAAAADHAKTTARVVRVAESISRANDRREIAERLLPAPRFKNGNGHT